MSAAGEPGTAPRCSIERQTTASAWTRLDDEYDSLGRSLDRRGASHRRGQGARSRTSRWPIPTWGVGIGGTRFAKFPIARRADRTSSKNSTTAP